MNRRIPILASAWTLLVLAHAAWTPAGLAQGSTSMATPPKDAAARTSGFAVLQGRWIRPDGGYVIHIQSVDANGKLEAGYANPALLPFAVAQATRNGETLDVFLELRAGGYNGSTYTLSYDPAKGILKGVYYQAVAKQKFDVVFVRGK